MILSGREIKRHMGSEIIIEPFDEARINPNSYNLSLHNELLVYEDDVLDMKKPNRTQTITIPEEGFLLEPGKLYLGRTNEYTRTETFVPMLEGRSSTGRFGTVHPCDGWLWRCGFCRLLDARDVLHSAVDHLSQCRGLPDLLPYD